MNRELERIGRVIELSLVLCISMLLGCVVVPPGVTPDEPSKLWSATEKPAMPVPEEERLKVERMVSQLAENPRPVTLSELIDYALKTNPLTRSSWLETQSSYADLGMERSSYYPDAVAGGLLQRSKQTGTFGGINEGASERTDKGPYASLNWLLFDFGGRESRIAEKRQALIEANYLHNSAVQQVVLEVQRSFYQYIALRSLEKAQVVNLKDAELNLDAAEDRRASGLATIADVLQAKTSLSRVQYNLQATRGQIQAVRGAVLTAAGLSPASKIDIGELDLEDLPAKDIDEEVETLIRTSQEENPTLLAARARVAEAQVHVNSVVRSGYPSLTAYGQGYRYFRSQNIANDYTAGVRLSYPLFTGFSYSYEVMKAKSDAERAASDYKLLENAKTLA